MNNDQGTAGVAIVNAFTNQQTFQITNEQSLQSSIDALEQRKYRMVIEIPSEFTSVVQQPTQKAQFIFHINESNPTMVKSMMQGIANEIITYVNEQSVQASVQAVLLQAQVPNESAKQIASQLSNRVDMKLDKLHPVQNFASSMIPMMMILACYAGSMMMAMQMEKASAS